ncbi:hypothetical protein [Bosea sp. (in: a-proteobacteria)]
MVPAATTRRTACLAGLALAALALPARAQTTDRIGVPGPIVFAGTRYTLAWSAQPSASYYKQEYLPADQTLERYERVLLVEVLEGGSVAGAAAAQARSIGARKGKDPLANVAVMENSRRGEIVVDFLLGGRDAQGGEIAEWNVYRYAPLKAANGDAGVLLFAVSHRAYGEGIRDFLARLKSFRPEEIRRIAQEKLPTPKPEASR